MTTPQVVEMYGIRQTNEGRDKGQLRCTKHSAREDTPMLFWSPFDAEHFCASSGDVVRVTLTIHKYR